jgi:hypothetical protein
MSNYTQRINYAKTLLLLLILFGACSPGLATKSGPASKPIFRQITVADGRPVTLGELVPEYVQPLLAPAGERRLSFRTRTFGGASAIVIDLTADGRVKAFWFEYPSGTDYEAAVRGYEESLGPPAKRVRDSSGNDVRTRWEDTATVFEYMRTGSRVYSVLSDRQLADPA